MMTHIDYLKFIMMKDTVMVETSVLNQFKNDALYVLFFSVEDTEVYSDFILAIISNLYMMVVLFIYGRIIYEIFIVKRELLPNRVKLGIENLIVIFSKVILEQLEENSNSYFFYLINLFIVIFFFNMMGLIPYTSTITAQIAVTFTLSLGILFSLIILVLIEHKHRFIGYFIPAGTPLMMIPYIFIIELISFLSKGFSLGIRLTANMFAGHVLLNIISKGIMFFFFYIMYL
jgi:ATP synthase subunit 6